ncbi:protein-glutamine gamma-glutamyltransferase [Candidatus Magnetomoraceae bacterium gMMP-15]
MEPHEQKWLFALDLPASKPDISIMLEGNTLISRRNVKNRILYNIKSCTFYNTGPLKKWELISLNLPLNVNLRAKKLAQKWREKTDNHRIIVDSALKFFRENEFYYSLNPPVLEDDFIDDFLFRTRKGYCEHYASAFAFLMRSAGIPCRIVGGYLGGELNPFGNYLIVRQSDAHVWAEVWLSDKGWIRVDPTSAVAPERVEQGMAEALPPEEIPAFLALPNLGPLSEYWQKIRFAWDAVNNNWNRWVMGYSFKRQKEFLSKIGIKIESWKGFISLLFMILGLISFFAALFFILILKKSSVKPDQVQKAYDKFCAKLAKINIYKRPEQGPVDYAKMVCLKRMDLIKPVNDITNLYVLLRYGNKGDENDLKKFKFLVKRFQV